MESPTTRRQRLLVTGLIILGLITVIFFGLRTVRAFKEFRGHRPPPPLEARVETDVSLIRDWMTIPFISKMYHVRSHILFESLEIPERGNREKSLKQLNQEYYPQTEGIVLDRIKATILANQPEQIPTVPDTPVVP